MHFISFETTRQLIEQHQHELLQEAELRRLVRLSRRPAPEPARRHQPATERPGGPVLAPVPARSRSRRFLAGWAFGTRREPAAYSPRPAAQAATG